jgi:hypothetical protein
MRKIEREMLEAISNKSNWHKGNTQVISQQCWSRAMRPWSSIFLHGNHIATWWHDDKRLDVNTDTFKEWPTTTTRSRLNALGVVANIRKGQACIDGVEL